MTATESLRRASPHAVLLAQDGWIVSALTHLENESVIDPDQHRSRRPGFRRFLLQSANRKTTIPPALSFRTIGETNYFHVLNDLIGGRLRLASELEHTRDLPIVIARKLAEQPFFRGMQSFPALREREWIVQPERQSLACKALHFGATTAFSDASFRYVQNLLAVPDSDRDARGRLLVLRAHTAGRSLANQSDVVERCRRYGFETIEPATMSFAEQVETFSNARIVVGLHGAAMANIAFRRNAPLSVVEILPREDGSGFAHYFHLSHALGFQYRPVIARPLTPSHQAELHVEPERLEKSIRAALEQL